MGELAEPLDSLVLWENEDKESTFMWQFIQRINKAYKKDLKTYDELHHWSVRNIGEFWGEVWDFTGVQCDRPFEKVSAIFDVIVFLCLVSSCLKLKSTSERRLREHWKSGLMRVPAVRFLSSSLLSFNNEIRTSHCCCISNFEHRVFYVSL